jgi:hypothetical protein
VEKHNVSVVRFSSSTFSLGGIGGAGVTGLGKVVVVGAPEFGLNMVFRPFPANSPVKLLNTPSGAAVAAAGEETAAGFARSFASAATMLKLEGILMAAGVGSWATSGVAAVMGA